MLTDTEKLHIQYHESIQLGKEILYMVDGGEDICCTLSQWGRNWLNFNRYATPPNATTANNRLFAMEFDTEFE